VKDKIFRDRLLRWFKGNSREFPWREKTRTPFQILIAEMLLRKTRAENVVEVYRSLIRDYPNPKALAGADTRTLEKTLRPLGLFKLRAKAMKGLSKNLVLNHHAHVPKDYGGLMALPHVGRYAANATLCFAFGERAPIVDANVQRIYSRIFGLKKSTEIHRAEHLWNFASKILPKKAFRDYNLALLDFAAKICKPNKPVCHVCFSRDMCRYYNENVPRLVQHKICGKLHR